MTALVCLAFGLLAGAALGWAARGSVRGAEGRDKVLPFTKRPKL